jgi:uncharacterized membrane protein
MMHSNILFLQEFLSREVDMLKKLGKIFVSGFFTLLPLIITIWILTFIFSFADGVLGGFVKEYTGHYIPGVGIAIIILASLLVGLISNYFLGKELIYLSEEILNKLPIVNTVYASAKKINEVLFMQKEKSNGKRVCAVEYPRKGIWSIGFATGPGPADLKKKKRMNFTSVFIANSPAPATGFTIIVPTKDVLFLDMTMEEAMQLLISGGAITG